MTTRARITAAVFFSLLAIAASYGGWAVVTVEDLPDYVVAQQPVTLTFTVRQHGYSPLRDLRPTVEARSGTTEVRAPVTPGSAPGQYTATLSFPRPGDWTVSVHSGFQESRVTLLPFPAVAAGARRPPALSEAERGRRLFVAKGCITCHIHGAVAGSGTVAVGPELTTPRLAAEYLRRFLADPSIKPPQQGRGMPDLRLKPAEIAALVTFLGAERQATR